jgi:hypothetical protein
MRIFRDMMEPAYLGGLLAGSEPCGNEPATGKGTSCTLVL